MFIVVTGCDGSGKSSAVAWLSKALGESARRVTVIDTWALNQIDRYPECRFLSRDVREIKRCGSEMHSPMRALLLTWMIGHAATLTQRSPATDLFLADGYWPKHAASEIELGFPEDVMHSIVGLLPRADLTLFLDVDPALALERKHGLVSKYECGMVAEPSASGFLDYQSRLRERLVEWTEMFGWLRIDANRDQDGVRHALLSVIVDSLNKSGTSHGRPECKLPTGSDVQVFQTDNRVAGQQLASGKSPLSSCLPP
jgi:dTMP kinase